MKPLKVKKLLLDALFPQFCINCHKEGHPICSDCLSLIEVSEYTFCPFCPTPQRVFENGLCPKHQNKYLDGLFSATSYQQGPVKKLIRNFKYSPYLKGLGPHLAYLIVAHFALTKNQLFQQNVENSVFIPMPLHKTKKRKRGFNQSEIIAKELSLALNIPLQTNSLIKIKKTESQTKLTKEERQQNIKNVFAIKNPQLIEGKVIFLVDDVFTTGSTMEEAARTLKSANATHVWGITPTREPLV